MTSAWGRMICRVCGANGAAGYCQAHWPWMSLERTSLALAVISAARVVCDVAQEAWPNAASEGAQYDVAASALDALRAAVARFDASNARQKNDPPTTKVKP